jgi:hypothetical protein
MDSPVEPARSADELSVRLDRLIEASKTNAQLRQSLLRDPAPVLAAHGIPLATGLRVRFIECDGSEVVIPLPKYEGPV